MKTQEELKDWIENLPKSEKAKMMFQIKKRESLDNEETKQKIALHDFTIDDVADFLKEKYPDPDFKNDAFKGEVTLQNQSTEYNNGFTFPDDTSKTKKKSSSKEILLSILYPFVAFIITSVVYILIEWFLDNVIINMLNWFNSLNFWLKIFLIIIGISTILGLVFTLARVLNAIICGFMNYLFPVNTFTVVIGTIFSIINSISLLIILWQIVPYWDLWFVVEFIIIASFIISMNSMLIPRKSTYGRYN